MSVFESSYGGDAGRIDRGALLECGVCWWVYDPAQGDPCWQIAPGTPFAELPAHWRCPDCDSPKEQFMVLAPGAAPVRRDPEQSGAAADLRERREALLRAYLDADSRMAGLPVYNSRLGIEIVGLQPWEDGLVCIAATPWCMNILLLPAGEPQPRTEGTTREVRFPSGLYSFIAGRLEGIGPLESCSLFSPMEQFDDMAVVVEVARHALRELLRPPAPPAMSRRGFLRGGRKDTGERQTDYRA